MGENSEVPGPLRMRVEVQGGEGTRLLRARSQGTEVPSGEGQSRRGKDSRSRWGSKRPDGLPKVGGGSGPDEKGDRGWRECGTKPASGDGDVADGEGGRRGLRWSRRLSPRGPHLSSSSSGTVFVNRKHLAAACFFEPSVCTQQASFHFTATSSCT